MCFRGSCTRHRGSSSRRGSPGLTNWPPDRHFGDHKSLKLPPNVRIEIESQALNRLNTPQGRLAGSSRGFGLAGRGAWVVETSGKWRERGNCISWSSRINGLLVGWFTPLEKWRWGRWASAGLNSSSSRGWVTVDKQEIRGLSVGIAERERDFDFDSPPASVRQGALLICMFNYIGRMIFIFNGLSGGQWEAVEEAWASLVNLLLFSADQSISASLHVSNLVIYISCLNHNHASHCRQLFRPTYATFEREWGSCVWGWSRSPRLTDHSSLCASPNCKLGDLLNDSSCFYASPFLPIPRW